LILIDALNGAIMWLIQNPDHRFLTERRVIDAAAHTLGTALRDRTLTLIIGNGPSQSAAWLHGRCRTGSATSRSADPVSWAGVVRQAAITVGYTEHFVGKCTNYLALAQAVLVRSPNIDQARSTLLGRLRAAFENALEPNSFDDMIATLAPHDIVTTNYDFQIERALERGQPSQWCALVRTGIDYCVSKNVTWVHKMHGSFAPPINLQSNYRTEPMAIFEDTVVITENDYDFYYKSLSNVADGVPGLLSALANTSLIIGKGLDPQDISFMYALRRTRIQAAARRYILVDTVPTPDSLLLYHNLGVTPLVMNLPRHRYDGHYYFSVLAALAALFPGALESIWESAQAHPSAGFADLIQGPRALAVGLAARNLTGRTTYNTQETIPPPGRRSMAFNEAEEHLGGAALTALMVLSALVNDPACRLAISSVIGSDNDPHAQEILAGCGKYGIDTDAVSGNQPQSWYSTVLVHTSTTHDNNDYPGQRIFLDRGYRGALSLAPPQMEQMLAQIENPNLRVIYLDKFLASQHPPPPSATQLDPRKFGPLLRVQSLEAARRVLALNPDLDILYEAGGGGSIFQHVEKRLSSIINIFTCGFPFFAHVLLQKVDRALPPALGMFGGNNRWWQMDFAEETRAVDAALEIMMPGPATGNKVVAFSPDQTLLAEARIWAGHATGTRHWFVTTLHHRGALGLDLKRGTGWYCPTRDDRSTIRNTSGAGDSFRGALMYALLNSSTDTSTSLPAALKFSTAVATERCRYFSMEAALQHIRQGFSGKYSDYEAAAKFY
jgi:sugar/nucleoside kinase (ribokinase family)